MMLGFAHGSFGLCKLPKPLNAWPLDDTLMVQAALISHVGTKPGEWNVHSASCGAALRMSWLCPTAP